MKQYLVAYVILDKKGDAGPDMYKVFIDENSNEIMAKKFYQELIESPNTYTANLCEILDSTDY